MAKQVQASDQPSKTIFDGVVFRSKNRPKKFNHKGTSYVLADLTEKQVKTLANDPTFKLFQFRSTDKK